MLVHLHFCVVVLNQTLCTCFQQLAIQCIDQDPSEPADNFAAGAGNFLAKNFQTPHDCESFAHNVITLRTLLFQKFAEKILLFHCDMLDCNGGAWPPMHCRVRCPSSDCD